MNEGGPPLPPPNLGARSLPVETLPTGTQVFRIHVSARHPRFFGRSGLWRFDSPDRSYGTLYAGRSPEVAFAETLLRGPGTLVAESELAIRSLCRFSVMRPLRVMRLYGRDLIAVGANASVTSGSYACSQTWSRALHEHPARPDGILYRATRDNDELAIVVFERAREAIDNGTSTSLLADPVLLGRILDHYRASIR